MGIKRLRSRGKSIILWKNQTRDKIFSDTKDYGNMRVNYGYENVSDTGTRRLCDQRLYSAFYHPFSA